MDSLASSSFCMMGAVAVVVVLAGQVLGSVVFCDLKFMKNSNILNSVKIKAPSTCQRVPLDVLLSSLKCDMSVRSLVTGVYIV